MLGSIVVAAEAQLVAVLGVLELVPFEAPADATYPLIRTDLESRGTPIGGNDTLTAAHARALDATLVTDNELESARVDGLPVENWLC